MKRVSIFTTLLGGFLGMSFGCTASPDEPKPAAPGDVVAEAELIKSANRFALELYGTIKEEPGNLFFSPLSVSTSLGMTYSGARGVTAEQMARTLHFPADHNKVDPALGRLLKKIQSGNHKGYDIKLANALWLQQSFTLESEFLTATKTHYGAGVRQVDFARDGPSARQTINQWVAAQTSDKIKDLLQPDDLTPLTRLVLTNAIYFKGNWTARFPKTDTRDHHFYRKNGDYLATPMMSQCAPFPYLENDILQVAAFPYEGKKLAMIVIVPRSAEGLPEVEKTLTLEKIEEWSAKLKEQRINAFLPRFKARLRVELAERLSKMGMPSAFDPDKADFTGMVGSDPQNAVRLGRVVHEAVVEINEEGTEAAGSTAAVLEAKGDGAPVVRDPTFRADRPFLFLIRDNQTGAILFIGRLKDPSK